MAIIFSVTLVATLIIMLRIEYQFCFKTDRGFTNPTMIGQFRKCAVMLSATLGIFLISISIYVYNIFLPPSDSEMDLFIQCLSLWAIMFCTASYQPVFEQTLILISLGIQAARKKEITIVKKGKSTNKSSPMLKDDSCPAPLDNDFRPIASTLLLIDTVLVPK